MERELTFTVTFDVTVKIQGKEPEGVDDTPSENMQGSLNDFPSMQMKDDQTIADDEAHGWKAFKKSFGPMRKARYPERKTHTCRRCTAPNRRFNEARGGCIECGPEGGVE